MYSNGTGYANVAIGSNALRLNSDGHDNVATGFNALTANTTGNNNVATGRDALLANSTGTANIALGTGAGQNLTTGSNNIEIGNAGKAGESGTIRIGNPNKQTTTFIAGINGTPLGGAQPVVIKSNGQLGTAPARSASTATLAATVERLQRQVDRLREQVKGG